MSFLAEELRIYRNDYAGLIPSSLDETVQMLWEAVVLSILCVVHVETALTY